MWDRTEKEKKGITEDQVCRDPECEHEGEDGRGVYREGGLINIKETLIQDETDTRKKRTIGNYFLCPKCWRKWDGERKEKLK